MHEAGGAAACHRIGTWCVHQVMDASPPSADLIWGGLRQRLGGRRTCGGRLVIPRMGDTMSPAGDKEMAE